jgi:transposase-like protein
LNLEVFQQVVEDARYRALFQAAILTAHEGGYTVRELADQLGISKTTLHRWVQNGRSARDKKKPERIPRVEVTDPAAAAYECNHRRLYSDKRKRVCLRCLLANFEGAPELRRHPNFDPTPEPKARLKYQPGKLKGGKG